LKLSTVLVAAVALVGVATTASATVTIFESYGYAVDGSDQAYVFGVNSGGAVADFTLAGTDLGALGAGATSALVSLGDPGEGGITPFGPFNASIPGVSKTFNDVLGDCDCFTTGAFVGTLSAAPEPASWALMLLGFGGLGIALRSSRKAVVA
jgi:PEP-CTERM motif